MNVDTIAQLKEQMEQEQQRLSSLLDRTAKHLYRREEPYSADFAEQVVEVENNQVVEALDGNAKVELEEIKAALKRIEDGSFGNCQECGKEIVDARLAAVPYTRFCSGCAD